MALYLRALTALEEEPGSVDGTTQLPVTPNQGNPMPSSDLCRPLHTHSIHTYTEAHIHKKKN